MYKNIINILNKDLDNYQKQLLIENSLTDYWKNEILSIFKNKKKLFGSEYGLNIIIKNLIKLDQDLNDYKFLDKRFLKGKKYKNLLLFSKNHDIISIVISNVLPTCIKYDNINNINVVSLVGKIGNEISKTFFTNEWEKYSSINKDNINMSFFVDLKKYDIKLVDVLEKDKYTNGIIFDKNLSEDDFKEKLSNIIGNITDDDYYLLGLDLLEYIAEKSQLFMIHNIFIEKYHIRRTIIPGKNLEYNILNIISTDSELLPMISPPHRVNIWQKGW